ncbi:MAG: xanthine dehydrogenase family protein subunit M [Actinomycetota bacterium]|nr:xanthine dehydrogenase family protein subunit M [Actinomycetota bacterium]
MKPAPFTFVRPATLQEALEALAGEPEAKVLAGGQSLVPLLSMRLAAPAMLVDINGLPDLDRVQVDEDGVRVGALARHADVLADPDVRRVQPLVALALANVAHPTIRNRGTTVGSLVHGDAAAEMPAVLALLDGSLEVASATGRRTIPAAELFSGVLETTVRHDEIALEAFFPALAAGSGVAFCEIARRHGDYAMCGVAAIVARKDDRVVSAKAAYLSVADVPTVLDLTDALEGEASEDKLARAGEHALSGLDPAGDLHASAAYRSQLVRVLTARALRAAYADAGERGTLEESDMDHEAGGQR